MNKKLLFGMLSVAGMILAASCSNDELIDQPEVNAATVSFAVNVEGAAVTRAVSDGTGATKLYYAVYDADGRLLESISKADGVEGCTGLSTRAGHTVQLSLVKGQEYTVAFWAQHPDAPYGVVIDNNGSYRFTVSMNYGGENNNDKRDAFFGKEKFTVTGDETKSVSLKRPFAQINVGTDDKDAAVKAGVNVDDIRSKVVIKKAATALDVITGEVSGAEDVTYTETPHPTEILKVEGNDYTWISMCYVLPAEKENSTIVSAEFTLKTGKRDIVLSDGLQNVPIRRNYRTNIIGSLLTGKVSFNLVVENGFNSPDLQQPKPVLKADTYEIENAAQWAWLCGRKIDVARVRLMNDIDLAGYNVSAFYPVRSVFTLDGGGKTIRNAVCDKALLSFEYCEHGNEYKINNITIEGVTSTDTATVSVSNYASALVGAVVGSNCTLRFDGVTMKNPSVKGVQHVGSLLGYAGAGTKVSVMSTIIEGCDLSNFGVRGKSGYVGFFAGYFGGTKLVLNQAGNIGVTVRNSVINAYYDPSIGAESIADIAAGPGLISGNANTSALTINKTELSQ